MITTDLPSLDFHRTHHAEGPKLYSGLGGLLYRASRLKKSHPGTLAGFKNQAHKANSRVLEFSDLSGAELKAKVEQIHIDCRRKGDWESLDLTEMMAIVVVIAERRLKLRAYPEQILAALAMLDGFLVEMETGEGKTLSIALAAAVFGWTGKPCHIITANDYLAQRDAENLESFFKGADLGVSFVTGDSEFADRQAAYQHDVVYTTAKELAADLLRDRLQDPGVLQNPGCRLVRRVVHPQLRSAKKVLRGLHTAIVDEADNSLIDEAVTPLIISRPNPNRGLEDATRIATKLAEKLESGVDYEVDQTRKEIKMTDQGNETTRRSVQKFPGFWQGEKRRKELIERALEAREFFIRGKQYVLQEDKIVIIDESTGRAMPNRSWKQGLHQAIESKEKIDLTPPTETVASISFQSFFRLFHRLSGTSGTVAESAAELWRIYGLPMLVVPRHKKSQRRILSTQVYGTRDQKFAEILDEVKQIHREKRPILIGTSSVEESESLAEKLSENGLNCEVLNAVRVSEEARIIETAGSENRITISTNMAGRGTDILISQAVEQLGGLHVIATERHPSGRIDRQLYGRAARQGSPGSVRQFASLEDQLVISIISEKIREILMRFRSLQFPGSKMVSTLTIKLCQRYAERRAYLQRQHTLKNEDQINESIGFTKH